jgi:hypothetical protein
MENLLVTEYSEKRKRPERAKLSERFLRKKDLLS